jgi:hypothetical protein
MKTRIFAIATLFASTLTGTAAMHAQNLTTDHDRLFAGRSMTYNNIYLDGGENATVAVQGDGDTTLRVAVYDYKGNLIDNSTCRSNACVVSWVANRNANFYVRVENLGNVYNDYGFAMKRYY